MNTNTLNKKIDIFYKKNIEIFRLPLEKIINNMLDKCRYINGESLERHEWGDNPVKLSHIPKNIGSPTFENDLLEALKSKDNEQSIIELLWGDIQLGKRVQACIIMWISVYILKRPVLYIFRNLTIDQKQLQDDIVGTEKYNFNIQSIKSMFEEFNEELQEYFNESSTEYWKEFKLPELIGLTNDIGINKLSNKEALHSNDIFCCLGNNIQLEKINTKLSEYIYHNDELVNITVLVDESDLMSATASNDKPYLGKDDASACEKLIAQIYKKVKYALHITGTAHSLLYNVTTRLSEKTHIQIQISKVHKMKRSPDYCGLFNNSIQFNTEQVKSWWNQRDLENNKKSAYDIIIDYNINIKSIIEQIIARQDVSYNSLLISEEKIRKCQKDLLDVIIGDFPDLFVIIYHGKCLRLYLSRKYVNEIKRLSEWESKQSTNARLWQQGGVHESAPIYTENNANLPNNYCYFEIKTKDTNMNIKHIYKLLSVLFKHCEVPIINKTIITITGKYGERGFSFTSDDYENYSLHLTDQYFVSHATFNCTDISQRLRLQGKYSDPELNLTLWTTKELQDVLDTFYVNFIKEIEKRVMDCKNWEEIRDLLEGIIDHGEMQFGKYMKYIDVSKKRKNIKFERMFDKQLKGYRTGIIVDNLNESQISDLCQDKNLPTYECINTIEEMDKASFIAQYGNPESGVPLSIPKSEIVSFEERYSLNEQIRKIFPYLVENDMHLDRINKYKVEDVNNNRYDLIEKCIANNEPCTIRKSSMEKSRNTYNILYCDAYDNVHITITKNINCLPTKTNDYLKTPYHVQGDKVRYSTLKEEYKNTLPDKYYWKTVDGWLYLYDKSKPLLFKINIPTPVSASSASTSSTSSYALPASETIDKNVILFDKECCSETTIPKLRFCLRDIYNIYVTWCKNKEIKPIKLQKDFRKHFEMLDYKENPITGVDINNKSGKKGYKLMVELN